MLQTNDKSIREAFHAKRLRTTAMRSDVVIMDELGLAHAKCRIDIAVISKYIHGYEIKSGRDSLSRLLSQLSIYRRVLQKLTMIVDSKHAESVLRDTPDWCGVLVARVGAKGSIAFETCRQAKMNPELEPIMLAHLLWRSEAVMALHELGLSDIDMRGTRLELYDLLCRHVSKHELVNIVRRAMLARSQWRDRRAPD